MKSVLLATDFLEGEDGNLYPIEINTNSSNIVDYEEWPLTVDNFEKNLGEYFEHETLHNFMQQNNLTSIHIIDAIQSPHRDYFQTFCAFYGYEFEITTVPHNAATIPDIEEEETTLLIRVAYDSYSLLDDMYARDNYELFNLIQSESFCLPTYFNTEDSVVDTLTELEVYSDSRFPNYIKKSRFPNYDVDTYPKLYKVNTEDELNSLKNSINYNEYLQKYCINSSSLSETEGRIFWYRNASLIISSTFETISIINFVNTNKISIDNEKLVYDSYFVGDSNQLNLIPESTFIPYSKTFYDSAYHFDLNDYALTPTEGLIQFYDIEEGTELKTIGFGEEFPDLPVDINELNNFYISSSNVVTISEREKSGIFINLTASNEEYGEFNWYDGSDTPYFVQKSGSSEVSFDYVEVGTIEEGDLIYVYNSNQNKLIPFQITNLFFDVKDIQTYKLQLSASPMFFIEIDNEENPHGNSPWFLVQHNACNSFCNGAPGNPPVYTCSNFRCNTCTKGSLNCISCANTGPTYRCIAP